jgi:hypothetical protein
MNDYIKEVLCNGKEDAYQYLLKWYSNVVKGKKNESVLYLKGPEGIGKSTMSDFIVDYVIGKQSCCRSNAQPLKTANNKCLMGKVLVVFEELPTFSSAEWNGVSATLKNYITGSTAMYEEKYERAIEAENFNNYVINTNIEVIQHSDGRRYYILDIKVKPEINQNAKENQSNQSKSKSEIY